MFHLTVAIRGQTLRSLSWPSASLALRSWQKEEETGYEVSCRDAQGATTTKAALRQELRQPAGSGS